jgi:hypothetical protein
MGITLSMTGAFRETGASFFFIPKGALTHHLQSRRWYPSLQSGRALFPKHPQDASPEGADNAAAFPCRHCLCGWQTASALFASSLQTVVLCRDNLPPACENLPQHKARPSRAAAFSQLWTMLPRTVHFTFASPKETKPPLAGGRKDVNNHGDLSSGSEGREPWNRPLRLRGVVLSELQRHLQ